MTNIYLYIKDRIIIIIPGVLSFSKPFKKRLNFVVEEKRIMHKIERYALAKNPKKTRNFL
jgi:hypothetical protein